MCLYFCNILSAADILYRLLKQCVRCNHSSLRSGQGFATRPAAHEQSHFSSFIFLQTSVVRPVFESIRVVAGWQRQVTVLEFSCSTTTQCWMISAVGGGVWLRMGGGVAATGGFFAVQPVRSRQSPRQTFLMPLFSLSPDRLSMAILVTHLRARVQAPSD